MEVLQATKPTVYTMMTEGKGEPYVPIPVLACVAFGLTTAAFLLGVKPMSKTLYSCIHIFAVGAYMLLSRGLIMLCFYTNWTWFLEGAYFGLAAWASSKTLGPRPRGRPRKDTGLTPLGYSVVALFHVLLAATIVVDLITWGVLWPMLKRSPDPARVAFFRSQLFCFTSYNTHGFNVVFLFVELLLNKITFEPYMLGWLGMYSSIYGLWAFSYYRIFNKWMYPFMDASRPGAILVYSGIYVGHWIFLGVLALLFEGKRRLLGVIKSSEAYKAH